MRIVQEKLGRLIPFIIVYSFLLMYSNKSRASEKPLIFPLPQQMVHDTTSLYNRILLTTAPMPNNAVFLAAVSKVKKRIPIHPE